MKMKLIWIFFIIPFAANSQSLSIPAQTIILNDFIPNIAYTHNIKISVNKFEISNQVTLKEYKVFLDEMKKDSGEVIYLTLLPDSSIAPKKIREEYFNSGKYDEYPVVGISWDNALRYCKWLTVKNNSDTLRIIYRLPNLYEYFSAYSHLQKSALPNDLNTLYADWLMDTKDESVVAGDNSIPLSYYYFHQKTDANALKRKIVMGKSFHHSFQSFEEYMKFSFYAQEGYAHIGFRIVTDKSNESLKINSEGNTPVYSNPLLQYWNLIPAEK